MGKGDRKRRRLGFKKGNKFSPRRGLKVELQRKDRNYQCENVQYVRLTSEEQSLVEDDPILPGALAPDMGSDKTGPTQKLLRSRKDLSSTQFKSRSTEDIQRAESNSYRLLHCQKLWNMVNEVTREHLARNSNCPGSLNFDFKREQKRGLCWRESVICDKCGYKSNIYSLYEEVETGCRGRRAAAANVGLNIAMTQTPIGVTGVRKLLLASNIPAPSIVGMQKTAKKVNKVIENANITDMQERRQQLKLINKIRGRSENEISVQADGMYNNSLWSGVTRTPYQPATQMAYIVAENVTGKHQIINVELVNKLCSKHGYHTQEGNECDIKSADCTATTSIETSIGDEKRWAKLVLTGLLEDGLTVKYITTDQDTAAHLAATELYEEKLTTTEPIFQVDTRHLSASHRKQMKANSDVLAMMPGKTLKYRQYLQNRFSTDLSKRCNAEYQAIHKNEAGDYTAVSEKMSLAINAIKRCYGADHSRCKRFSLICQGEQDNNWLLRSAYLNKNFKIDLTNEHFEQTLLQCIEYRLGTDILQKTRLNTNSQKVEATNRCLRKSLPKNSTFARNFPGRAHSAIHSVNNGPGESIRKLCQKAGCPIPSGGQVAAALNSEQRRSELKKQQAKLLVNKSKRIKKATELYRLYEKNHERIKYIRSQLARKLRMKKSEKCKPEARHSRFSVKCSTSSEHAYSRNLTGVTAKSGRRANVDRRTVQQSYNVSVQHSAHAFPSTSAVDSHTPYDGTNG